MEEGTEVGQFWTPIQAIGGSLLHAGLHIKDLLSVDIIHKPDITEYFFHYCNFFLKFPQKIPIY